MFELQNKDEEVKSYMREMEKLRHKDIFALTTSRNDTILDSKMMLPTYDSLSKSIISPSSSAMQ